MIALLIFAVTKILELSRFNLNNGSVSRAYYDFLSLSLLGAILLFFFLSKKDWAGRLEAKAENIFSSRPPLLLSLDLLLAVLVLYESWRYSDLLYLYPVRCGAGDMLPAIRGAAEQLAVFSNPFDKVYCPWNAPFGYLPMMMVYYLPGVLLKFDIRFISYFCFLLTLFSIYRERRRRGSPLGGFLIVMVMLTSPLFRFYMLTVQDFPFVFVVTLALFAFTEKKNGLLYFCLALALATRQIFAVLLPFFLIAAWKTRRVRASGPVIFAAGLCVGFFPAFFYPRSFILNLIRVFPYYSQAQQNNHFLIHSLGLSYYFFDRKTLASLLFVTLLAALYVLALKALKESNLWLFLALGLLTFLFFTRYGLRPEEYYYLPLFAILTTIPVRNIQGRVYAGPPRPFLPVLTGVCVALLFLFPLLAAKGGFPVRLQGSSPSPLSGSLEGDGRLEFSLAVAAPHLRNEPITFLIRRKHPGRRTPLTVSVRINDRPIVSRDMREDKIRIDIDWDLQKKYFIWGSNAFEVTLDKPEPFLLKLFRNREGQRK
jgi:hypothetical protein